MGQKVDNVACAALEVVVKDPRNGYKGNHGSAFRKYHRSGINKMVILLMQN